MPQATESGSGKRPVTETPNANIKERRSLYGRNLFDVISNPYGNTETVRDEIESNFLVAVPSSRNVIDRWRFFLGKENNEPLSARQVKMVIGKFLEFHNAHDKDMGAKEGHNSLTNFYYSDLFLPALVSIYDHARQTKNHQAQMKASFALLVLNDALDVIPRENPAGLREFDRENLQEMKDEQSARKILYPFDHPSDKVDPLNLANIFPDMYVGAAFGASSSFQDLRSMMAIARIAAYQCINEFQNQDISISDGVKLPKEEDLPEKISNFKQLAEYAQHHFEELQFGINFPDELLPEVLMAKAFGISSDYNSVWNKKESYANSHLITIAIELINQFVNSVHRRFPDKEVFFAMNTGRPGLYIWGVLETLSAVEALRVFGFTECGGVVMKAGMTSSKAEVAVDNPLSWETELNNLQIFLAQNIKEPLAMFIEPKKSMLSFQISPSDAKKESWILHTKDNQPVTPEYIAEQTQIFLQQRYESITDEQKKILDQIQTNSFSDQIMSVLTQHANLGADGIAGTGDEINPEVVSEMEKLLLEKKEKTGLRLAELRTSLQTINMMSKELVAVFNPRAGYMDISNENINKWSTLIRELEKKGYGPNEVFVATIGDAYSDIIPESETGDQENNRGADKGFMVSVGNASETMKQATIRRKQRNGRAYQTTTSSILGLMSMIRGLTSLVNRYQPEEIESN